MPSPMRQSQRRRQLERARVQGEKKISTAIAPALSKRFKWLKRDLRRANLRKRLVKASGILYKDDVADWPEWVDIFTQVLTDTMEKALEYSTGVENQYWISRGKEAAGYDPRKIVADYESRVGRKIKKIGQDTLEQTQQKITEWYNSEAALPELLASLEELYGPARAELIARTEIAGLTSQVQLETMGMYGIDFWNWDLADEVGEWPCDQCIAQADKNPHRLGDPMPPDASHPGCRCGTSYATAEGTEFFYE